MTTTLSSKRIVNFAITFAIFSLTFACATSKRAEPAGSATPVAATAEQPQPAFAKPPPAKQDEDSTSEGKAASFPESTPAPRAPAAAPASRKASGSSAGQARPSAAVSPKRAAEAESFSASKKTKAQNTDLLAGPDDLGQDPLSPNVNDSTVLRVALQDWRNAADQLTTSQGCDDGCRAFQSMQRAAVRICNLVLNQDPAQRCAAAKARVSEAERNLTQRCGKCER